MTSIVNKSRPLETVQQSLLGIWQNDAIRVSAFVFIVLRVVTLVAAYMMVNAEPAIRPAWMYYHPDHKYNNASSITYDQSMPANAPLADITAPWNRFDTAWYIKISIQGYQADPAIVFPPLYPALIRLIAPLSGGNYVLAGLIISSICCFLFFVLLYQLIEHEFPDQVARKNGLASITLILVAAFPTAYYLIAAYTEALFMALSLAAFVFALRREWSAAGLFVFFATLTRMQGLLLCIPMAWLAFQEFRQYGLRKALPALAPVFAAPIAYGIYTGYMAFHGLGTFDAAYRAEWGLVTVFPIKTIAAVWDRIERIGFTHLPDYEQMNILMVLLFVVLAVVVTYRMKPIYWLYVWANLFLMLMRYHINPKYTQLESISRYVLVLFPCFIVAAMALRRWGLWIIVAIASGRLQGELLNRFVHWKWVA